MYSGTVQQTAITNGLVAGLAVALFFTLYTAMYFLSMFLDAFGRLIRMLFSLIATVYVFVSDGQLVAASMKHIELYVGSFFGMVTAFQHGVSEHVGLAAITFGPPSISSFMFVLEVLSILVVLSYIVARNFPHDEKPIARAVIFFVYSVFGVALFWGLLYVFGVQVFPIPSIIAVIIDAFLLFSISYYFTIIAAYAGSLLVMLTTGERVNERPMNTYVFIALMLLICFMIYPTLWAICIWFTNVVAIEVNEWSVVHMYMGNPDVSMKPHGG